jgi:hypothetical protein
MVLVPYVMVIRQKYFLLDPVHGKTKVVDTNFTKTIFRIANCGFLLIMSLVRYLLPYGIMS